MEIAGSIAIISLPFAVSWVSATKMISQKKCFEKIGHPDRHILLIDAVEPMQQVQRKAPAKSLHIVYKSRDSVPL
jgi:hypothetical protein